MNVKQAREVFHATHYYMPGCESTLAVRAVWFILCGFFYVGSEAENLMFVVF
jgi:hypothetical protein